MSSDPRQAFLKTIQASPDDDLPRLIYADWLEEQGDPRAEFIRLQCELARRTFSLDALQHADEETRQLWDRSRQLEEQHGAEWRADLPRQFGVAWENFHRGFVNRVTCLNDGVFLDQAESLFAATSLEEVAFLDPPTSRLEELVESPWLERIRHLDLSFNRTWDIPRLLRSAHLEGLESLDLTNSVARDRFQFIPRRGIACRDLKHLNLDSASLGYEGMAVLCRSSLFSQLQSLNLRRCRSDGNEVRELAESGAFPRLRFLGLGGTNTADADLLALGASPHLQHLEQIDLRVRAVSFFM